MCGIIGYLAKEKDYITKFMLSSLKKLEYRGYDSAGLCLEVGDKFLTYKSVGEIKNLQEKVDYNILSNCGIAHTRWATHGKVCENNTHPHISQNGNWVLVHNGIIENYETLKEKYLPKVKFYGETDTEVLPNLMEKFGFFETLKLLSGSFSICAMNKNSPKVLYIAKRHSPLYVAQNKKEIMVASDPIVFAEKFSSYTTLNENSYAILSQDKIEFFDFENKKIYPKTQKLGIFEKSAEKGKYPYFAEKEIKETPKVLENILQSYSQTNYLKKVDKKLIENTKNIYLVACGTAYHSCLMGEKYLEKFANIPCKSFYASEFRYFPPKIDKNSLCIFVSQSGETADTLMSLNLAKQKGAKTLALVNVPYSSIAKNCDTVLPICAGMEIAVMSTKAYNAMLFVFFILAHHLENLVKNTKNDPLLPLSALKNVNFLKNIENIDKFVDLVCSHEKVMFIGKGEDYVTSKEASLKLKEITYINSISIPSGELKHGTLALVDDKTLVFVTATNKEVLDKNLASCSEIKSRGGKIVLVTNLNPKKDQTKNIDEIFQFAKCPQENASMLSVVFFQYLAYKTCLKKRLNPDKPRNLAKSVTVE